MSQTLREIAEHLQARDKKVHLVYAFNGTGKTRLSREFKKLVAPKLSGETEGDEEEEADPLHPVSSITMRSPRIEVDTGVSINHFRREIPILSRLLESGRGSQTLLPSGS
ncbi:MAG: hypothetical protein ACJAVK_003468 [Akkermansiaceae bacterium]|jgi:hypothetical protein